MKGESVEEEMEEDDVALSTVMAGLGSGRPSMGADIVEHVGPYFANSWVEYLNLSDRQREIEKSNAQWTSVRAFTEEYFRGL